MELYLQTVATCSLKEELLQSQWLNAVVSRATGILWSTDFDWTAPLLKLNAYEWDLFVLYGSVRQYLP